MFDYSKIPKGYYDRIAKKNRGIRSFWHLSKFAIVQNTIPPCGLVVDVGCFAGTFLSLLSEQKCKKQIGIDLLPEQLSYATELYGTDFRSFQLMNSLSELSQIIKESADVITVIEVIEHLSPEEITTLIEQAFSVLAPNGRLYLTTPNYLSFWPIQEWLIQRFSDIDYQEQHITKFNIFTCNRKLNKLGSQADFRIKSVRTSHFLLPLLSVFSFELAMRFIGKNKGWRNPFGSILHIELERKINPANQASE